MANKNKNAKLDSPKKDTTGSSGKKDTTGSSSGKKDTTGSTGKNDTRSITFLKENGMDLRLVADGESGEGLPYAPINWPNPGDVWGWKVGKRINGSGYMADRYLCLPNSLQKPDQPKLRFASLQSVRLYIKNEFPKADADAFFASFSWRVPSKGFNWAKDQLYMQPKEEKAEHSGSKSNAEAMSCKAGNRMCSVQQETKSDSLPSMDCNLCCSETGFCRNCCCILCCRTIGSAYGGYSFIRCEAKLSETHICGHIAHLDCAVRSFMAGTVGGAIGLDVEYYCRRCDHRTDLVSHVTKLLKTCKSLDSRDDIEKVLKVGLCILRGSQRDDAMKLLNQIKLALVKLKSASLLEQIWNIEDYSVDPEGAVSHPGNNETSLENLQLTDCQYPLNLAAPHELNEQRRFQEPACTTSNHQRDSSKSDDDINQVLQELRRSQEIEYRIAEERLKAKKGYLLKLYEQLDKETLERAKQSSSTMDGNVDSLLINESGKVNLNQIKQELKKLKDMKEIGKGFGRTPKGILKEHFGLQIED